VLHRQFNLTEQVNFQFRSLTPQPHESRHAQPICEHATIWNRH
jgi:hypothetical protein